MNAPLCRACQKPLRRARWVGRYFAYWGGMELTTGERSAWYPTREAALSAIKAQDGRIISQGRGVNSGRIDWKLPSDPDYYGGYGDNLFCGLNCGYRYARARIRMDQRGKP